MSAPVAFCAAYSDFKLIKTRGVVSISFEIPLKDVDLALRALGGMPDAAKEQWFGIAALQLNAGVTVAPDLPVEAAGPVTSSPCGEKQDRPVTPRKPVAADKRLAQQAGILCADRIFWRFLREGWRVSITSEADAAAAVRELCAIGSRAEIVPGSPAAEQWIKIESRFTAWKLAA